MRDQGKHDGVNEDQFVIGMLVTFIVTGLGTLLLEWPALVWSTLHLRPALVNPLGAPAALIHRSLLGEWKFPEGWAGVVPSLPVVIVLDVLLLVGLGVLVAMVKLRIGLWGGRSRTHLSDLDPRKRVRARPFAQGRDWAHLQPDPQEARSRSLARMRKGVVGPMLGEDRRPAPRGGDGWNMGLLRGQEVRSAGERHLLGLAPSRSGKSLRIVCTEAHEHDGPLVITSNKMDVVAHTLAGRRARGPVWVFAPMSLLPGGVECACWTPLLHCESWEGSLRMGQWLHDADPDAGESGKGDGAARFYDRGAIERLLPPVLHAAALDDLRMADVYHWLTDGPDALDVPAQILAGHGRERAAAALRAVQAMDSRAQTILMMSAARLLAVYRFPQVQAVDEDGFTPQRLLTEGGTLYLIAPESEQDALAPIFGAMLGAILRECEQGAAQVADPRELPLVKILADEAAHLTPLGRLPAYLAVSAGHGVRWCVIYQSVAQIRARYGQAADAIIANTLCKLVLGPIVDRSTREEIAGLLGEQEIEQTSTTSAGWQERTRTTHEQQRPKLGAEQLAQLGDGDAIAFHSPDLPALVHLPFWWEWFGCRTPQEALRHIRDADPQEAARRLARQFREVDRGGWAA